MWHVKSVTCTTAVLSTGLLGAGLVHSVSISDTRTTAILSTGLLGAGLMHSVSISDTRTTAVLSTGLLGAGLMHSVSISVNHKLHPLNGTSVIQCLEHSDVILTTRERTETAGF